MEPMIVTISYTAFLMTIVGGVAVAAFVYFIVVLARVNRIAKQVEGKLGEVEELLASLRELSAEATETMVAARLLCEESNRVVADIAVLSGRVRTLADSEAGHALSLIERLRIFATVVSGARTAFSSVRQFFERRRRRHADDDNHDN